MTINRRLSSFIIISLLFSCAKTPPAPTGTDHIAIAVPYELYSLDPHEKDTLSDIAILSHFYEPLVIADNTLKLKACLARGWENTDPLTWIFHLQPSVKFHSGKKLEAQDVVYSFERVMKSQDLEMTGYLADVREVRALDPLTVLIRIKRPLAIFAEKVRMICIIPQGSTAAMLRKEATGTGPYLLAGWNNANGVIRMTRNENYWGNKPDIREADFYLHRSPEEALGMLQNGTCRFIQCNSRKLESELSSRPGFQIQRGDTLFVKYVTYDLGREVTPYCSVKPNPFRNRLVREALNYATDRNLLAKSLSSYATAATQPVPPFVFGHNPSIPSPVYDLAKARSLLKQAALAEGFHTRMLVRRIFLETALLLKDQWKKAGIDLELQVLPDPEVYQVLARRDVTLFLNRWSCPSGDASDFLDSTIHSVDAAHGLGRNNNSGYSSPTLDQAIDDSYRIQDTASRRLELQKIMTSIMNELLILPLYVDQDTFVIDNTYRWKPRPDGYIFAWEIETQRR